MIALLLRSSTVHRRLQCTMAARAVQLQGWFSQSAQGQSRRKVAAGFREDACQETSQFLWSWRLNSRGWRLGCAADHKACKLD
jgi:hypothetical protein